jgi:hypothetical protein
MSFFRKAANGLAIAAAKAATSREGRHMRVCALRAARSLRVTGDGHEKYART